MHEFQLPSLQDKEAQQKKRNTKKCWIVEVRDTILQISLDHLIVIFRPSILLSPTQVLLVFKAISFQALRSVLRLLKVF